jgi:hypothetical protein
MTKTIVTLGDLNSSVVYGSTGGYTPSGKDCATWSCNDLRTITATAGEIMVLLSKSKDMEIHLIGTLLSKRKNCLRILDQTKDFPCLDEAIQCLDDTGILNLMHWEWLGSDRIFLVYGPGYSIKTL